MLYLTSTDLPFHVLSFLCPLCTCLASNCPVSTALLPHRHACTDCVLNKLSITITDIRVVSCSFLPCVNALSVHALHDRAHLHTVSRIVCMGERKVSENVS